MKFVFAPDSFKGTLSAEKICAILAKTAKERFGEKLEVQSFPLADGGEGTVRALQYALGGEIKTCPVCSPYGETVRAAYAVLLDGTYILEMAQASGITLSARREPMEAETYGFGQLLMHAIQEGAKNILIGIGGSATNDGGIGFLTALGARFSDEDGTVMTRPKGKDIARVASVDFADLFESIRGVHITVMCDVTNPLCGPNGATSIYGPQKGVASQDIPVIDKDMAHYAEVIKKELGADIASLRGAGAAGGMGAALGGVMHAEMRSGIDAVLDLFGFDNALSDAALCITGEGRMDAQSVRFGKAIAGIARRCAAQHVPLAVIAGSVQKEAREIYETVPCAIMVTPDEPMPLQEAMANAEELFTDAADRLFRTLEIGMHLR